MRIVFEKHEGTVLENVFKQVLNYFVIVMIRMTMGSDGPISNLSP